MGVTMSSTSMTRQRPNMTVYHSVLPQSPLMQRKHIASYHRRGYDGDSVPWDHSTPWSGMGGGVNNRGPKIYPWGTAKVRSALEDKQSPSLILWHFPVRYDSNQSSAFPVTTNQSSTLLKIILWSMVSKAAERSWKVSVVTLPAFIGAGISINARKSLSSF